MAETFRSAMQTAERLQQRAERKRGGDAAALFAEAVVHYRKALAAAASGPAPPAADHAACLFGLAESLQEQAEAVVAACAHAPDPLSADMVRQADSQAVALLHEAVAAFGQVLEAGQPRADALVCAGNALSTCAEVAARGDVAAALPLLEQAAGAYEAALRREEDALTWSNLADALVQHASLCCEAGLARQAQPLFSRAMHAYQRCCSLSDALAGDDLPGLLCNWSRGLLAAAQQAQDPSLVLSLLGEAEQRLQRSIDFLRGSDEPLLALGDVLLERGERLAAAGDTAAASHALQRALGEGYQAVQRISARSPEAAVGVADVHVQAARLAAAGGQAAQAAEHWAAAEAGYRAALQQPTAFDFRERSDMRYNHACCLSRCGRHSEAAALLRQLVAVGGASEADARQDGDLQGVVL